MDYLKCPGYHEDYIEKTGGRLCERIYDHHDKKGKSHMAKHFLENNHKLISFEDLLILQNNFTNSKFKGKYRKRCSLNN